MALPATPGGSTLPHDGKEDVSGENSPLNLVGLGLLLGFLAIVTTCSELGGWRSLMTCWLLRADPRFGRARCPDKLVRAQRSSLSDPLVREADVVVGPLFIHSWQDHPVKRTPPQGRANPGKGVVCVAGPGSGHNHLLTSS